MGREQWKTRTGFLCAAIGCAVGLGNIWRFPYVAYTSGGGTFFIPYFIALLLVGLPLMIMEHGLGHREQGSAPLAFARVHPGWEWLGWWAVIFTAFAIACYYNVVLSWCLNYLAFGANLAWGSDPNTFFFEQFLQKTDGPFSFGSINPRIFIGLACIWAINWYILRRGITRGIELAGRICMPLLFVLILFLVGWSLTLPGASLGIKAYLTPDFSRLWDPTIWRNAFGHIFFSLSLGYGMMIAYGSYLPQKTNLKANAIIVGIANSAVEVIAAFAVFSLLGFMALRAGKPVSEVVSQSIGLSFVAYPEAINQLPGGQHFFAFLFFIALLIAGITSSIAMGEAFIASAQDKFSWSRKRIVDGTCLVGFLLGILFTTGSGLYWLDLVDHFINQFGVIAVALLQCLLVTRVLGKETFIAYVNAHSSHPVGWPVAFGLTIFTPTMMTILLGVGVYEEIQTPYGGYPIPAILAIGGGWLLATLLVAFYFSRRPWQTTRLDTVHAAS
ncbi:MAG: sodium-dependent transporter [Deltaproteobacteria bacterium]|nr:sodium-dependent transporter [Deltaproteobacteria bacterium]